MSTQFKPSDLTKTVLGILFLLALMGASFWIMLPFLSALLWATMVVISTWPLMLGLQARLWGRRGLAATVMTLALLMVLIIPLGVAVGALVSHMDEILSWAKAPEKILLPQPPAWVDSIPMVGAKISQNWRGLAAEGSEGLAAKLKPYAGRILEWFVGKVGGLGGMVLQFLLIVIISAILYVNGEAAAQGVRRFAHRLAGDRGDRAALLAAGAIRGVAMGVVVTAVSQSVVAGLGLMLTSVPGAALLTSAVLVLCLAQLGPMLIMIPAIIWKYQTGDAFGGSLLLVFALVSGTMDNFLRPVLIKKGADLPLLLIIAGVIGGMISLGIMGIFIGPVVLAVTHTLLNEWIHLEPSAD
ncbi:MAG: AI-2E family transporter YdiK [Acidobacteria bacterium]|nr:AI-2E family transporter YdiK [Acidobacteriota bacterium]